MQTTTVSHLRKHLKEYLDKVEENHEPLVVPRGADGAGVVIVSLDDYNSMNETAYLLSSPNNRERLLRSIKQVEEGNVVTITIEELDKL